MVTHTILVTDDDTDHRESIMELLELEGYVVETARNGLEALGIIQSKQLDLILCDINMPIMTGLELLSTLRAVESTSKIPFILITGNNSSSVIQQASQLGATGYILKPMDVDTLLRLLQQILK